MLARRRRSGGKRKLSAEKTSVASIVSAARCFAAATGSSGVRPLPARSRRIVTPPTNFAACWTLVLASESPRDRLRRRIGVLLVDLERHPLGARPQLANQREPVLRIGERVVAEVEHVDVGVEAAGEDGVVHHERELALVRPRRDPLELVGFSRSGGISEYPYSIAQ